jgi:hypothetical protein
MATPTLRYACQLAIGADDNLTYAVVNQTLTLSIIVSTPEPDPVRVDSITFGFGPFGDNATNLARQAADITAVVPDGWAPVAGKPFSYRPTIKPTIGTEPVTFVFRVAVNSIAGNVQIAVTDVSNGQQVFRPPLPLTKMPAGFVLRSLSATPAKINPGDVVTLQWTGTPGATNTVSYVGGTKDVVVPSSGRGAWTTPGIETNFPSAPFTVTATAQSSGGVLSAQIATSVFVDVPEILSFPQPGRTFFSGPVALQWTTRNAERCSLYADGQPVTLQAPANSPAAGFSVSPRSSSTQYALYAHKGKATTTAQPITVRVKFAWTKSAEIPVSAVYGLFPALDGSYLYLLTNAEVAVVDTTFNRLDRRFSLGAIGANVSGALSPDGKTLYVGSDGGGAQSVNLATGEVKAFLRPNPRATVALNAAGTAFYSISQRHVMRYYFANPQAGGVSSAGLDGPSVAATSFIDSSALLCATAKTLYRYDANTFAVTRVSDSLGVLAASPNRATMFTVNGTPAQPSLLAITVSSGRFEQREIAPFKRVLGVAVDARGGVYLSTIAAADAPATGDELRLYYIDSATGERGLVCSVPFDSADRSTGAVAINPRSGDVYLHALGNVQVFTRASDTPLFQAVRAGDESVSTFPASPVPVR